MKRFRRSQFAEVERTIHQPLGRHPDDHSGPTAVGIRGAMTMIQSLLGAALALAMPVMASAAPILSTSATSIFHKMQVDGIGICYR